MKLCLGICCGASTVTAVSIEQNDSGSRIQSVFEQRHEGDPRRTLRELFSNQQLATHDAIAVTGRRFRHFVNLTTIPEPLAVEHALGYILKDDIDYNAVVSVGGETLMAYRLDRSGKIAAVYTGNKCASGTGEFFLQQIRRLDVDLKEIIAYAGSEKPYVVSGRCSVFCKSDCTHATNKGVPKSQVVAGLCVMMASKVLELLTHIPKQKIMLVGGASRNSVMVEHIRKKVVQLTVPKEAPYFEALGAALWASEHKPTPLHSLDSLFTKRQSQFQRHRPLRDYEARVTFAHMPRGQARAGDSCIAGVDVGSTTTKMVLLRESDLKILASEYLRTNGDPIGAARACYASVIAQIPSIPIHVRGLGVTGSGRKLVGLHALTEGVINEIIAHAAAAVHFDAEVDTIFEIGGQDAKYTHITNGVASDYAMNEACSAGTGSFLEESAREALGVGMEDIAAGAMQGLSPANFNDQCAAFISSDVKNALHEGMRQENVLAGLVYSICMNYVNRVKAARPVGNKVSMQGGVCYNKAVPVAMAALIGKQISVPPEPGLAGAYGVALEVKTKIESGLLRERRFDLKALAQREVAYKRPFTCKGGPEKCDLGCSIARITLEGRTHPFGGACNRYYNQRNRINIDAAHHDLVAIRQRLVFTTSAPDVDDRSIPSVGINRAFLTNTYYPFFATFFADLGLRPMLSPRVDPDGVEAQMAPFCFPGEIAHGTFKSLIDARPDYLFLPHIRGMKVKNGFLPSNLCPLLQGEPFYLASTFESAIDGTRLLTPLLDFSISLRKQRKAFTSMAAALGVSSKAAAGAFEHACAVQETLRQRAIEIGKRRLAEVEADPARIAVVLFGRSYNAYAIEANKGIPHKFASRAVSVLPVDFLDLDTNPVYPHMYWSMGQIILKAAITVRDHPQLFGTYITNFSCGPDSFLIGYFRDMMGSKPSLTLELDNHTADAGLETRIEAFLDIVERYRHTGKHTRQPQKRFLAETVNVGRRFFIQTPDAQRVALTDPRVKLVFPSMSQFASRAMVAACRAQGVCSTALPAMTVEDLNVGKSNTLCKECLPLQLTTGALLRYIEQRAAREITVYFMPTAEGPCRFGQYRVFLRNLINKRHIPNVALLSLSTVDNYAGMGLRFVILGWYASVIGDCFEDIHNTMLANADSPQEATARLAEVFETVLSSLAQGTGAVQQALVRAAHTIACIPMARPLDALPRVLVVGEIYVRKEALARRWLPEYFAQHGIAALVAPIHEWLYYVDWLVGRSNTVRHPTPLRRARNRVKRVIMSRIERQVKATLASSGWYRPSLIDMDHLMGMATQALSQDLCGEAILTVANSLAEAARQVCGIVSIGPFGCMPNRLSESLLNKKLDRRHLTHISKDPKVAKVMHGSETFPFLSLESDGGPFPQIVEARLETFILQALRTHARMAEYDQSRSEGQPA